MERKARMARCYTIHVKVNPNSYFISDTTEIKSSWFKQKVSVGICGATSTPLWLMQKVAQKITDLSL